MDIHVTALERAFELARSGNCPTVGSIKQRLKAEGYSLDQVTGRMLSSQLRELIKQARGENAKGR